MKTRVKVRLVAETEVEMDVEHEADEEPTDLTQADVERAFRIAQESTPSPEWQVDHVEES